MCACLRVKMRSLSGQQQSVCGVANLRALTPRRFACVYTSHVSNLLFYSPLKSYKGKSDTMIHEDELNM